MLMKVENAVKVEPVGEFELKGIRRPLAAYNVVGAVSLDGRATRQLARQFAPHAAWHD